MKSLRSRLAPVAMLAALLLLPAARAADRIQHVVGTANNRCVVVNGRPEYWVDGKPFFEHAAAFFYYRLPRDRWAEELARLKSLGINTLDILPLWNWHQPEEEVLDFDGHTNPRRDLKYLLQLADLLGFKVTLRPGPYDTSEWRNGGYPDWLLRRPEYHMSEQAILEGRYPRWSALQYEQSEEAATQWLKNDTHLRYTQEWYDHLYSLVRPLLAGAGGPVISLQLDDDQAIGYANYNGPNFWKYMDLLRKYAQEAVHHSPIPIYLDAAQMRVNAEANDVTTEPFWNLGQDYQWSAQGGFTTPEEAAKNKFLTDILKTQPLFAPIHIEFQAGWFPKESDTYAALTDPSNTLVASRVMFQNGLKGLSYFPPNDTLYPAGYEVPWTNHFYGWEAAVNYAGKETARAVPVRRNGRLIAGMGPLLASSHFVADAGLIYPMATFPQADLSAAEADYVASFSRRVLWSAAVDHINLELIDSDHSPAENFRRYGVLLLPNLVSGKAEVKRFPHLERYSDKAQRMVRDYVAEGGTLVAFPSLPKGKAFDELFEPFGKAQPAPGETTVRFADGTTARALASRFVLTLPKKQRTEVKVFARDARGGIVGASVQFGEGRVLFFGADFSRWAAPAEGPEAQSAPRGRDYSEEAQKAARPMLAALLKEAGAPRQVAAEVESPNPRDPGLYVTELLADPREEFERARIQYAFVGVTNFAVQEARTVEVALADPRSSSRTPAAESLLRLPRLTLPPRESLLLPVRVPLRNPYWETAPGLETTDEIYYATAELSHVDYDGKSLRLEFTAPAEAEVALRLSARPTGARIDGTEAAIQEDGTRQLYVIRMPHGSAPHFVRVLEVDYPREGPRITIQAKGTWITGETRAVRLRVENPNPASLEGDLDFVAGSVYKAENPPLSVHIPGRAAREFSFPIEIPTHAAENQSEELIATLRETGSAVTWAWKSQATIHHPFDYSLGPTQSFPLREDQSIPIVHPLLTTVNLPGDAVVQLHVKNWLDHEQVVTLATESKDLNVTPASSQLVLPPGGETTVELRAPLTQGSGVYRFGLRLHAGSYAVSDAVLIAALREGDAIAYKLDYDRDGFEDLILENRAVRCFLSPQAGGRSFAYVFKETNANVFDSVGGMRDSFLARFEPGDMKGLPDWTNANWLGLYNRPYSLRVRSAAGAQAEVEFEYEAPDIYPKGVTLKRVLTLAGNQNVLVSTTSVTPQGIDKPQAYVLETSVPFRGAGESSYNQWFSSGHPKEDFAAQKTLSLEQRGGYFGTINKNTGLTFALMFLTPPQTTQVVTQNHSALIRAVYPAFAEKDRPYTYRVGYYLGKEEIEKLAGTLESGAKR
jgi:hypothetical protein